MADRTPEEVGRDPLSELAEVIARGLEAPIMRLTASVAALQDRVGELEQENRANVRALRRLREDVTGLATTVRDRTDHLA